MHISVVVPVYLSAESLSGLCREIKKALLSISEDYEIILVDDYSCDRTWPEIEELVRSDDKIKGVRLSRNFGQHAATLCGISMTKGEWIVTIDDDLEQNPGDISKLYYKAGEGYDVVYGVYSSRTHSFWRNVTSSAARWLFKCAIPNLNHEYTSFRVVNGKLARSLSRFTSPFPFIDGYLSWITNNYSIVDVGHGERTHGRTNYTLGKLLTHTINIFVTFSDVPLRIASWIGIVSSLVGLVWLITIVAGKLLGFITVSGFTSIMASITLFGGIQLLIIGVFGEYLGRINFKSSNKPLFLVSEKINLD